MFWDMDSFPEILFVPFVTTENCALIYSADSCFHCSRFYTRFWDNVLNETAEPSLQKLRVWRKLWGKHTTAPGRLGTLGRGCGMLREPGSPVWEHWGEFPGRCYPSGELPKSRYHHTRGMPDRQTV
jgi:hypothetical protein